MAWCNTVLTGFFKKKWSNTFVKTESMRTFAAPFKKKRQWLRKETEYR